MIYKWCFWIDVKVLRAAENKTPFSSDCPTEMCLSGRASFNAVGLDYKGQNFQPIVKAYGLPVQGKDKC